MSQPLITEDKKNLLRTHFGSALLLDQAMARYSVMQVGGPADYLMVVNNVQELEDAVSFLWEMDIPYLLLGSGSNTLISDAGIREVVIINEAKEIQFFDHEGKDPLVRAESGASFGNLARRTGAKGWSGLEWASSIPGTVGGAVVNNAGAFGSDMAANLKVAEILHLKGAKLQRSEWSVEDFEYDYRTSVIKSGKCPAVVLAATFKLERSTPALVKEAISRIAEQRKSTQPQGASLGSMFKNPPGDYSGRLIEQAGLKGTKIGDAQVSDVHANFFVNHGNAAATEIAELIALVRDKVDEKFGIKLELEIQFVGDWSKFNR